MESFLVAVNAVVPFLIYISFGYGVRLSGIVDEAFMNKLNSVIFRFFFPTLMFDNLYNIKAGISLNWKAVGLAVFSLLLLELLLVLIVPRVVKGNPQRGVIIQATYRSNFVLFGIPLAASLYGASGSMIAAMMVAIIVPIYNVTAVIILEMFQGGRLKPKTLIKNVCTNPLILGAATGLVFFCLGIRLPQCVALPISQFADLTTPLALFVLGGTMHFSAMRGNARYLIPPVCIKLVLLPALILAAAGALGLSGPERFVLFTMYATPVATSSYAMAQNMGGDGELAGEFVVISTAASVFTIFLWVLFLTNFGYV